jgi:hypothetical protein
MKANWRMACHLILISIVVFLLDGCVALAKGEKNNEDHILGILNTEQFRVVHRVRDLPTDVLLAAGVIPRNRNIASVIVDPGQDYQRGHGPIDFDRADSQLIFGAVSNNYVLFCYWTGGLTEQEHVMLIRRDGEKSKLILHTTVFPEARSLSSLRVLLRKGYEPFDVHEPSML